MLFIRGHVEVGGVRDFRNFVVLGVLIDGEKRNTNSLSGTAEEGRGAKVVSSNTTATVGKPFNV